MPPRRLGSRASRASSASAGLRAQSASRSTTSSASRRLSPSPSSSRAPSSRRASPSAGTRKAALAPGDRDVEYSVLLPVYNERENLPLVVAMLDRAFSSLPSPAPRWEVVVVEDASPDGTLAVAHALQAAFGDDRVVVLSRPGKMGLGTAYVDGLRLARGQFVFIMDADMSHHVRAATSGPRRRPRQGSAATRVYSLTRPPKSPQPSPCLPAPQLAARIYSCLYREAA